MDAFLGKYKSVKLTPQSGAGKPHTWFTIQETKCLIAIAPDGFTREVLKNFKKWVTAITFQLFKTEKTQEKENFLPLLKLSYITLIPKSH